MRGTTVEVDFVRVVDGDTIKVKTPLGYENIRILCLDTEESRRGSSKPETLWGHKAKEEAGDYFNDCDKVILEFPGDENPEICWQKYRGKYDRPLTFVYKAPNEDFQEHMIRKGYSPYFVKYGYAEFKENHDRYTLAERNAQIDNIGVWNQNKVNGSEMRNYAVLCVWWHLRAKIFQNYRDIKKTASGNQILNPSLDYQEIVAFSEQEKEMKIFSEIPNYSRVGGKHGIIRVGSQDRPFDIFIPQIDEADGKEIINLLNNRYITTDIEHPKRNYAYFEGLLKKYRGRPEIVITSVDNIKD